MPVPETRLRYLVVAGIVSTIAAMPILAVLTTLAMQVVPPPPGASMAEPSLNIALQLLLMVPISFFAIFIYPLTVLAAGVLFTFAARFLHGDWRVQRWLAAGAAVGLLTGLIMLAEASLRLPAARSDWPGAILLVLAAMLEGAVAILAGRFLLRNLLPRR